MSSLQRQCDCAACVSRQMLPGATLLPAPGTAAAPVHLRGAVLVDDDHAVLHGRDGHVEGGVAVTAQAHALPAQSRAVKGQLPWHPVRQLVRRDQFAHLLPCPTSALPALRPCGGRGVGPRLGASILGAPRPSSVQEASPLWPASPSGCHRAPKRCQSGKGQIRRVTELRWPARRAPAERPSRGSTAARKLREDGSAGKRSQGLIGAKIRL